MIEEEDLLGILRRTFNGGILRRLPKKREDAEAVMALAATGLDPDVLFDESEINVHLSAWLDGIADDNGSLDYVTLRRYLVDHGFLRRATDGVIYRTVPERVTEVLSKDAQGVDPKAVFAEVASARTARRKAFGRP